MDGKSSNFSKSHVEMCQVDWGQSIGWCLWKADFLSFGWVVGVVVYFFKLPKEDLGMKWYILQHFEPKAKESFGNSKKFKGCLDSEVSEVLVLSYFVSELGEPVQSLEDPFQQQRGTTRAAAPSNQNKKSAATSTRIKIYHAKQIHLHIATVPSFWPVLNCLGLSNTKSTFPFLCRCGRNDVCSRTRPICGGWGA